MLTSEPDLSWRDVQSLLVRTAIPVNPSHELWQKTYAGRRYSPQYGYGKIDAGRLVAAARSFDGVGPTRNSPPAPSP